MSRDFSTFVAKIDSDNQNMDFSERLDRLIEDNPEIRTRKALASMVGVSVKTISAWKVRKDLPRADVAVAIGRLVGATVEYLVTGADSTDPWLVEHRQLIADLKALDPARLALITEQVAASAQAARAQRQTASGS